MFSIELFGPGPTQVEDLTANNKEVVLNNHIANHGQVWRMLNKVRLENGQGKLEGGGGGGEISYTVTGN